MPHTLTAGYHPTVFQDLMLLSGFSNNEEKSNDVSPGGGGEEVRGRLRQKRERECGE